jgi:UDP-N-acetylmuramoylalanine--D-glutamate ligase
MKRNESILVYGVTGLLMVILFVAVVFGDEARPETPASLEPPVTVATNPELLDPIKTIEEALNLRPAAELPVDPPAAAPEAAPETAPEQSAPPGEAAPPAAAVPATPTGVRRVGDYREVTVRPGDTFSLIVQRWTGSLDKMPLVEALNEDVDKNRLEPGRTLLLPWVDDAQLIARAEERPLRMQSSTESRRPTTPAPAPESAPGGSEKSYVIKAGDSLWRIAQQATTSKGEAAEYVARLLELNPGLEPERLRVGQKIKVP